MAYEAPFPDARLQDGRSRHAPAGAYAPKRAFHHAQGVAWNFFEAYEKPVLCALRITTRSPAAAKRTS